MPELAPLPRRAAELVGRLAALAGEPLRPALAELAGALRAEPLPAADPAARLAAAARLSPFEHDLLLLAGLPEEHEAVAGLARLLQGYGEPWFTGATAAAVLELDPAGRRHLRRALDGGPLARLRLVAGPDTVPLPERGLRLPPGLWSVLRGVDAWPATLHPIALPALPGDRLDPLATAVAAGDPRLVVLTGEGRDDLELAALAAGSVPAPVVVPAAELDAERTPAWSAHLLARGAVPVVAGRPAGPPLPAHPGPVVVAAAVVAGLPMDDRPVVTVDLPRPDLAAAIALWRDLLPELNGAAPRLAGLLRVGRLGAVRAVRRLPRGRRGLGRRAGRPGPAAHRGQAAGGGPARPSTRDTRPAGAAGRRAPAAAVGGGPGPGAGAGPARVGVRRRRPGTPAACGCCCPDHPAPARRSRSRPSPPSSASTCWWSTSRRW